MFALFYKNTEHSFEVQGYLAGSIIMFIYLCSFLLDCTILRRYELTKTYIHAEVFFI